MAVTPIKPGDVISKDWWPPAVKAEDFTNNNNITSTTWVVGSPEVGVTFTAPSSGRVCVCLHALATQQAAGDRVFVEYRIYLGTSTSGTLFQTNDSFNGISSSGSTSGTSEFSKGHMSLVEGLTPGSTYYAVIGHLIEGAGTTSDVNGRRIIVFPTT
jgi:hypothetical protein